MLDTTLRRRPELHVEKGVLGLAIEATASESDIVEICAGLRGTVDSLKNGMLPDVVVVDCREIVSRSPMALAAFRSSADVWAEARWRLILIVPDGQRRLTDPFLVVSDPRQLPNALEALKAFAGSPLHVTPEEAAWARAAFGDIDEQQLRIGLGEIERMGGLELKDFIHELELDS
jgi:hypothetical protein